ncbi:hypothetical protein NOG12_12920, partial [Pseudidiomarina sp. GXY010]|nr:hypothetical protein [Pseudidiomarina sp. GXY010]
AGTDPTGYIGCGVSQMADSMCPHMTALENATTDTSSKPRQNASSSTTLDNGVQINDMSRTMKNGNTVDLMSQGSLSKENVGKPELGDVGGDRGLSDFSVTNNEWDALANEDLATLYKSRAMKGDNVGNVGLGIWGSFEDNIEVHGYLGAIYWNKMVGTLTTLNTYAALSDDAAYFPFMDGATVKMMMAHIHNKPMAIRIAQEHLNAVQQDYNNDRVGIRGLLSERQITRYHHRVFREFNANVGRYGGTIGHGELPRPMSNAIRDISKLFYCQPACDSN